MLLLMIAALSGHGLGGCSLLMDSTLYIVSTIFLIEFGSTCLECSSSNRSLLICELYSFLDGDWLKSVRL